MLPKAAVFVALLPHVLAAVHDRLAAVPSGWVGGVAPDDNQVLSLIIGLKQQNIGQLESKLLAVSTPGSPSYGQHLDAAEVNALFAPSSEANSAVQSWLTSAGVSNVHSDGHWVTFSTTVAKANQLLDTTFLTYESSGVKKVRTTHYSVPDTLAAHIDLISPTTYFGKTVGHVPTFTKTTREPPTPLVIDASCQRSITPKCLKELYNVGTYVPNPKSGSIVGFGSFLNQSALYADLFQYEQLNGIPSQNFSVTLINGGTNDQQVVPPTRQSHEIRLTGFNADFTNRNPATAQVSEADLDVQNIIGVGHPLPVVEFITGGSPPFIPNLDEPTPADNQNEPYIPYYQYLLAQPNSALPQVISNSYGDDEQTVPLDYAIRVCNMIGMLGLRGITVIESSGDTGIGAPCQSNDGKKTPQFTPTFPGTCPYVLSVGGTQAVSPEIAWLDGSGGFSNYFTRPSYQDTAVQTYLTSHISASTKAYYEPFTNFSSRGFPDISAHSLNPNYQVVTAGSVTASGGTSAAAPVVAAIIGLLNDARLLAGKSSLGFINPMLYSTGFTALNDITGGGNRGCNGVNGQTGAAIPGASIIPFASWNATVGWDPVTGLGTPDFTKLKTLVLSL